MIEYIGYPHLATFKIAVKHLNEASIFIVADSNNDHAITKENGILYEVSHLTEEGKKNFLKDIRNGSDEKGNYLDVGLKTFKLKKPVKPLWYLFGMFGVIKNFPKVVE